jgi:trigger factor
MATVTRENIGQLNDKITVSLQKEDYLGEFEKSIKNYSKQISLPGFRKGMVPAGIVKKKHGQAVFVEEVLKTVEKQLMNYMDTEKLEIIGQPLPLANTEGMIDMNKPGEYSFNFEIGLKPEFSLPDLSSLPLTRYKIVVSDEMISKEVERLRKRHGKDIETDVVNDEDSYITFSISEIDAAGNVENPDAVKSTSFFVSDFNESGRATLIGRKVNEELTVTPDQLQTEKAKKWFTDEFGVVADESNSKQFRAKIDKITGIQDAELNDEFFEAAYPGRDIKDEQAVKDAIKQEIETYWSAQTRNQLQHELYHKLLDNTEINFPSDFLKRWLQQRNEKEKAPEEVEREFPGFLNQLKWSMIMDKIMTQNEIKVEAEDIRQYAKNQLFGYMGMPASAEEPEWVDSYLQRMLQDKKFVNDTYSQLEASKVLEWAETQAKPEEKEISVEEFTHMLDEHKHHHH